MSIASNLMKLSICKTSMTTLSLDRCTPLSYKRKLTRDPDS